MKGSETAVKVRKLQTLSVISRGFALTFIHFLFRSEVMKFQFLQANPSEARSPHALYEWKGCLPVHQERRSLTGDTEASAYNGKNI